MALDNMSRGETFCLLLGVEGPFQCEGTFIIQRLSLDILCCPP